MKPITYEWLARATDDLSTDVFQRLQASLQEVEAASQVEQGEA
jgi:hypothetical protein